MNTDHTAKRIEKFTGAVRLNLPKSFHLGLVDLLNRELRELPPTTGAAVKENCVAAVALVMKSSRTEEIYKAEEERRIQDAEVMEIAEEHIRLDAARERFSRSVGFLESLMFKRSTDEQLIDHSFRAFCEQVSGDKDGLLLIQWATGLLEKRRSLKCA